MFYSLNLSFFFENINKNKFRFVFIYKLMSLEYQKLLNMVNKLNDVRGEKCLICHFPDKTENLIQLRCKHYFHENCIKNNNNQYKSYIICPYCEKSTLKSQFINHSCIHVKCQAIINSGINKGNQCGRINCKYHSKKSLNTCQVVLKSGIRKGEICGRSSCKYHTPSIVV
mgnify:CR=1 FL=1